VTRRKNAYHWRVFASLLAVLLRKTKYGGRKSWERSRGTVEHRLEVSFRDEDARKRNVVRAMKTPLPCHALAGSVSLSTC